MGGSARTQFFNDNTAFVVDLYRIIGHKSSIIMHNQQTGIQNSFPQHGNVIQHVHGLLYSGSGVDIPSKTASDAFQVADKHFSRKVFCAVQAHMLQEVGKTCLAFVFLDGSYVGKEVKLGTLFRFGIVPDIIRKPVIKFSNPYRRVVLQGFVWIGHLCETGRACHQ